MKIGLVWATNVGKSTLFNRLIWQFRAIVTDIAGTTTDILRHSFEMDNVGKVTFADSPGLLDFTQEWPFIKQIIDESDLILFVIDDSAGITAKEKHIFQYLMENNKKSKVALIINKLDIKWKDHEIDMALADYYEMWFPHVIWVSAKKERNVGEVTEFIEQYYKKNKDLFDISEEEFVPKGIPMAIIGKPNAGKSTLLNTFVWNQLSKVEDKAGTTRDYITGEFQYGWKEYTIYDTAGIKRKWHMHGIEKIAYKKTLDMLKFVRPVVVFMVDATVGISHRDMSLLSEINHLALPVVFVLNKTDLLDKKQVETSIKKAQAFMDFAKYIPILPMVATTGQWQKDLMKMINAVWQESNKRINTHELNKAITTDWIQRPPRFPKNKICRVYYVTQIDVNAPTFMIFINHKNRANFAFKKWLENTFRRHFGFVGVPLVFRFKEKSDAKKDEKQEMDNYEK